MEFIIGTINDNGTGMNYSTKEDFLKEISLMIDDAITNGATYFNVAIDADACCFSFDKAADECDAVCDNCKNIELCQNTLDDDEEDDYRNCVGCDDCTAECFISDKCKDCSLECQGNHPQYNLSKENNK